MDKHILKYTDYLKMLENGVDAGSGLGNITAPQPSTNSGSLNGGDWANGGGTIGSGDRMTTLGTHSEQPKFHDPVIIPKKKRKKKKENE